MACKNYLDDEVRRRLETGVPSLLATAKPENKIVADLAALWAAFTKLETDAARMQWPPPRETPGDVVRVPIERAEDLLP